MKIGLIKITKISINKKLKNKIKQIKQIKQISSQDGNKLNMKSIFPQWIQLIKWNL